MTFSEDPRISVLPREPKIVICDKFKNFDVLNPKYKVCRFKEVKIGQFFRWKTPFSKHWLRKNGPIFCEENTRPNYPSYFTPHDETFVLVILPDSPVLPPAVPAVEEKFGEFSRFDDPY